MVAGGHLGARAGPRLTILEARRPHTLSLRRRALRRSIVKVERLQRSVPAWLPPVALGLRWLSNRYVPWAARTGFRAGIHDINGVLMEIPRPPNWGGGGEFHMSLGTYEPAELAYVTERLRPGDTFVDVGAHIGYYTLPVAKRVGHAGQVVAIEPTASSVALLHRNLALNGIDWVTVVQCAASASDGAGLLSVSSETPMWNALTKEGGQIRGAVAVRTVKLDTVLAHANWPTVAGIKIDAEGSEMAVLRGASEVLRRNPHAFLLFEVCGQDEQRRSSAMETLQFLERRGYAFRRLRSTGPSSPASASNIAASLPAVAWQQSLFNVAAEPYNGRISG